MRKEVAPDHYETLQISPNADGDTIQRVFRLLAQRYHPDNPACGNAERFRQIHDAYRILSDPEARARYDIAYASRRQDRWRLVDQGPPIDDDFDLERQSRRLVLEILYTRRRMEPGKPGISHLDLAELTGRPREHLEFTCWYLVQKKLVSRDDQSSFVITADGVDYLEQHPEGRRPRQLPA
jgi:curved DNA-binding protein